MSDLKSKTTSLVLNHEKFQIISSSLVSAIAANTQVKQRSHFKLSIVDNICLLMNSENIFQVKQVHAQVTTSGLLHILAVANKLLCAYTHHRNSADACLLFNRMGERNLVSWSIMIGGFAKVGDYMHCLGTFRELIRCGAQPDNYTLPSAIKACRDSMRINTGRLIHCCVTKYGLHLDQFVCAALVDMYAKCGVIEDAKQLFDKMPIKDLVTWTVMIGAYAECGNANESLVLFDRLREEGFVPDKIAMVEVVNACAKLGAMNKARLVHDYISENKFSLDVILGTAIIDMYAKCGSVDSAREIFDKMRPKNVITWSVMISAYGYHGQGKKALELFPMMLSSGILPNKITFVALLYACGHAGLVEEGLQLFSSMFESYGVMPDIKHCTCMVDLFGRAGRLNEALRFIENMTVEKDDALWSALLGACWKHNCIDMVEEAAKSIKLQSQNPGHYLLLSNIYANAGWWKEMAEIRDLMTKRKLKKIPGYAWIEVDNVIYQFSAADTTHAQAKEIFEMLKTLSEMLELAGYVHHTKFALQDDDELSTLLCTDRMRS